MIPCRYLLATIESRPCTWHVPPCAEEHERTVYRLADGTEIEDLVPGDVYIEPWSLRRQQREGTHSCSWDNCDGQHVICTLPPNRHPWNIDGRASNCDMPDDRAHRCWVRHGSPQDGTLHVDKAGHTCKAGAGSIQVEGYHGHLHNWTLT